MVSPVPLCRRRAWWVEAAVVLAFYLAYAATRAFAPGTRADAETNAQHLIAFERAVHIHGEHLLNHALTHVNWLSAAAGYYYLTLHFAVTVAVLVAVYLRRPHLYPLARTSLVVASYVALLAFWFIPVAPPRLAENGIADTVVQHNVFGAANAQRGGSSLENIYAAMPSLHVGWAVWVALVGSRALPPRWGRLCWLYPLVTASVVLSTGNHYVVDAVAGAALVLAADTVCRAALAAAGSAHLAAAVPAGTLRRAAIVGSGASAGG